MSETNGTKTIISLIAAVFGYAFAAITEIYVVLAVLMIVDYITGVVAGMLTTGFDKNKGLKGFVKKLMYPFLLLVAIMVDYAIYYFSKSAGIDIGIKPVVSIAMCAYLIGTEGLSICQNIVIIGLPVPGFLESAFGLIRDSSGKLVKIPKGENPDASVQ